MSLLSKAVGWLFGGGGATAEKVLDVADKAFHTEQERATEDAADLASARSFAAPSNSPGVINHLVDATNRLIRPWITIELGLRWFGYKEFPDVQGIDPFWQTTTWLVLTFWFGGRAILKDLPQAIKLIRGR